MTILVDKSGKVFFGIDGQDRREQLINKMAQKYGIILSEAEIKQYTLLDVSGNPIGAMKDYLNLKLEERENPDNNLGIPVDSTDNQLKTWVKTAREINRDSRIAIKADQNTPYSVIKKIMKSLQQIDENRYNLITRLEEGAES
jgi:hypothetical protein